MDVSKGEVCETCRIVRFERYLCVRIADRGPMPDDGRLTEPVSLKCHGPRVVCCRVIPGRAGRAWRRRSACRGSQRPSEPLCPQQAKGQASARFAGAAAIWKRGDVKDDTVYCGLFIWCIYQHPAGEDPRRAALEWAEEKAATMRSAGIDVQIAKLPE